MTRPKSMAPAGQPLFIFDVIVVGGGHAGTEAAHACACMGIKTLLITHNVDTLGQMSCNPSIGGIGKSHLVKEIDALGGVMAKAIDQAGIHFRTLNMRKGYAVRATRAQADRTLYKCAVRRLLESQSHLTLFQSAVDDIVIEDNTAKAVLTQTGLRFYAEHAIILTAGTFLGGRIHIGHRHYTGGRAGEKSAQALSEKMRALPFQVGRLKTGTPPRIDRRGVDFDQMVIQPSEPQTRDFSFVSEPGVRPEQLPCFITHTTEQTHAIIRENLKESAMYSGNISGTGPRYCPSIEDKVVRFSDKASHRIFIEPEGIGIQELYPSGLNTSLPFEVQCAFLNTMKGLEKAWITRPGYAIEYDFFDPRGLTPWLETQYIQGLFFAGQINGTTGYEEAAAQGLLAGINAGLRAQGKAPWYPLPHQAYLGVLVQDLITHGVQEPYRMFTSRAAHRLSLREDNADLRLTEKGHALGVVQPPQWRAFSAKKQQIDALCAQLKARRIPPQQVGGKRCNAWAYLGRTDQSWATLLQHVPLDLAQDLSDCIREQVEIQAKYAPYIQRQRDQAKRLEDHASVALPARVDYTSVPGLSIEMQQKLTKVQPTTLAEAMHIPGVTPAAISVLWVYIKQCQGKTQTE